MNSSLSFSRRSAASEIARLARAEASSALRLKSFMAAHPSDANSLCQSCGDRARLLFRGFGSGSIGEHLLRHQIDMVGLESLTMRWLGRVPVVLLMGFSLSL